MHKGKGAGISIRVEICKIEGSGISAKCMSIVLVSDSESRGKNIAEVKDISVTG